MTIQVKPLNKDIIVRRIDNPEEIKTSIFLLGKREKNYDYAWCEVMAIGPLVSEVNVGDRVMFKYGDQVQPFILDGEVLTLTDESKIQLVISE